MATQVQFRRGTTSQNNAFTGAQGELTIDTDVWTFRIHDGTTAGGRIVPTLTATQTFTNKTLGSNSSWAGNSISLSYGGTGTSLSATPGAVAYSASSSIAFSLAGTAGQVLTSGGTNSPTWVNASSLSTGTATTATTATNIAGGSAGQMAYQSDTDTTAFITAGTQYQLLQTNGSSSAPTWVSGIQSLSYAYISGTTDSSSDTSGVLRVAGGASVKKNLYVGGNAVITGNLTVNGTTTTVNSTTLTVDDKNIELGSVDTPTDTTADGGGITLKGATDKTIIWDDTNDNWTSSEHWNIASGKSFKIVNTKVLEATKVLADGQTSITIGDSATTIAIGAATGTTTLGHQLKFSRANSTSDGTGQILLDGATGNRIDWNTAGTGAPSFTTRSVGTKLTLFPSIGASAADYAIGINSATLWTSVPQADAAMYFKWYGGETEVASLSGTGNLILVGDLQVKGGDLTTNQTTFNLLNATATTVNAFGGATTIGIGAATGTLTINNAQTVFNSVKSIQIPVGTSAERPTAATGQIRYNSDLSTFEGYGGTAWGSLGGVKSVDGLTYIIPETSAGGSNDELEFYTATDASNTAKRGGWNKTRLLVNTPILVSSQASLSEYPNALIISSNGDTTNSEAYIAGVVGEGVASGADSTKWGVGVYGAGTSSGATKSAGVIGKGIVSATGDTGSAVGVRAYSTDTHAGGLNVAYYAEASGSGSANYALWMESGNLLSNSAQTWTLYDNQSSALTLGSTGKADIIKVITTDAAEGVTMSGTLGVTGVATLSSNATVGGTLGVTGNQTNSGDLAVNGGDITTTATTFNLLNTTATTVNFAGAATTVNIGSAVSGADVNVGADLHIAGNLYVTGTQSTGSIATISGADSVIYTNAGAAGNTKEIGLIGEYYSSGTKYTGLLKDHTDGIWKFFSNPTAGPTSGTTQSFTGATYDAVQMGALTSTTGTFSTALNSTGDFKVATNKFTVASSTGNTVVAGTLGITSDLAVNTNKFTVAASTGNTLVAGTLSVTGHVTVESVTSTGATGTGAFVFGTSPSLTTPVLGVATATSINKMAITAPATSSTLAVADGKTFTVSNTLTLTGTDASSVAFGGGGTVVYTANKLSVHASTSSSELAGVISDETGSGVLVFGTSPTFTTSIDSGATFGAFASSTALTLGYTGTGASSTTNISTAALSGAYTKTINIGTSGSTSSTTAINLGSSIGSTTTVNGTLSIAGSSSGAVKFVAASAAGSVTYTLPSADAGASGYALISNGSGTLSWSAVGASTATDDTTTNSSYYPVLATATSGALSTVKVSSTKLTFNPSTGTLTATALTESSSIALKENVSPITNALDKIMSLVGVTYDRKDGSRKNEAGLIAEDVYKIIPNVVETKNQQADSIAYTKLTAYLIEAVKEQQKQIEELKAKLGN